MMAMSDDAADRSRSGTGLPRPHGVGQTVTVVQPRWVFVVPVPTLIA